MKRLFIYASIFILSFAFFYSCQRGISALSNSVSDGSLLKDNNGNCAPVNASGMFIKGDQLNDSNYLEVSVNIISPGLYNITTDTVNGYFFKAKRNPYKHRFSANKITCFWKASCCRH